MSNVLAFSNGLACGDIKTMLCGLLAQRHCTSTALIYSSATQLTIIIAVRHPAANTITHNIQHSLLSTMTCYPQLAVTNEQCICHIA